jgi:hypothetical protein
MDNHYHLLVRCPTGELALAMREIGRHYVRLFNRRQRRDGPLFRSRFASKLLNDDWYRSAVLAYIDRNPVAARLSAHACDYPWGSAWAFECGAHRQWLESEWTRSVAARALDEGNPGGTTYRHFRDLVPNSDELELIDARLKSTATIDPLQSIDGGDRMGAWLRERARETTLQPTWLPIAGGERLERIIASARLRDGRWETLHGTRTIQLWSVLRAGLLQTLAASFTAEIAARLQVNRKTALRLVRLHHQMMLESTAYETKATGIARESLRGLVRATPGHSKPGFVWG